MESMETALVFGIFGFLVANVLIQDGEILAQWRKVIIRITMAGEDGQMNPVQYYIYKVTWGCSKCIAGFWSMVYCILSTPWENFSFWPIFSTVVVAIFFAYILQKAHEKYLY